MRKSISKQLGWFGVISLVLGLVVAIFTVGCQGPAGPEGPAGAPGTSIGTISGVITGADGKPVEKATVVTNPATKSASTDASGKYQIADIPIGIYSVTATAAGHNAGYKAGVSLTGGTTVAVNLKLGAEEPFALAKVKVVSGTRDAAPTEVYPDGKVAITLSNYLKTGQPFQNNNKIITSGLPNVGVGTYVYLEGRAADAKDKKITGYSWKFVEVPAGFNSTLENANTRFPRFLAAKAGEYIVELTATNEENLKASSTLEVNAGTYVGAKTCGTCHNGSVMPDVYNEWLQTGHAPKVATTFNSYSATSDYCIRCHVVGYDETANNDGFDDRVKQLGWDSKKESFGSFIKSSGLTLDKLLASSAGDIAGIQCENCHGPGGSAHTGAKSYQPGVCTQCHPQQQQWNYSGHSLTGASTVKLESGETPMHMAENASCVKCHTGEGFVQVQIRGKAPVFPNMATPEKPATLEEAANQPPVACATCHDPHKATEPVAASNVKGFSSAQLRLEGKVKTPVGVTVDAGISALCVSCHANNRDATRKADFAAGKSVRSTHENTQSDIFYGIVESTFNYGQTLSNSPHTSLVKNGCVECHMAPNPAPPAGATADGVQVISSHGALILNDVGGHSWNMASTYQGSEIENVGACNIQGCHASQALTTFNRKAIGDYDGNGKIEGIQDEVRGLIKLLEAKLPKDDKGNVLSSTISDKNTNETQRQAVWNYWLVVRSGDDGIHNTSFTVQLLQKTYKSLTGSDVPGATLR